MGTYEEGGLGRGVKRWPHRPVLGVGTESYVGRNRGFRGPRSILRNRSSGVSCPNPQDKGDKSPFHQHAADLHPRKERAAPRRVLILGP